MQLRLHPCHFLTLYGIETNLRWKADMIEFHFCCWKTGLWSGIIIGDEMFWGGIENKLCCIWVADIVCVRVSHCRCENGEWSIYGFGCVSEIVAWFVEIGVSLINEVFSWKRWRWSFSACLKAFLCFVVTFFLVGFLSLFKKDFIVCCSLCYIGFNSCCTTAVSMLKSTLAYVFLKA